VSDRHEVSLSASAERDIERLPAQVGNEVRRFLSGPLRNDPRKAGTPLTGNQATMFEAKGNHWRVLYQVDANTHTVRVMVVAHRRSREPNAS
jgi:mRNA-degrading endonuclease RelE of RelBE toxin-antitoxin system